MAAQFFCAAKGLGAGGGKMRVCAHRRRGIIAVICGSSGALPLFYGAFMVNQVKPSIGGMPPVVAKTAAVYLHNRTARLFLLVAALSGFLWVSLGAIAGHEVFSGLHASFFDKAHRYQIVCTLALMLLTTLPLRLPLSFCCDAGLCWLLGLCCFCGSLYVMAF